MRLSGGLTVLCSGCPARKRELENRQAAQAEEEEEERRTHGVENIQYLYIIYSLQGRGRRAQSVVLQENLVKKR